MTLRPSKTPRPTATPRFAVKKQSTPAPSFKGVQELVNLTSPVNRGDWAQIKVRVGNGVSCTIIVGYGEYYRQGMQYMSPESDGTCLYTWQVPKEIPPGSYSVKVQTERGTRMYAFAVN